MNSNTTKAFKIWLSLDNPFILQAALDQFIVTIKTALYHNDSNKLLKYDDFKTVVNNLSPIVATDNDLRPFWQIIPVICKAANILARHYLDLKGIRSYNLITMTKKPRLISIWQASSRTRRVTQSHF